MLPLLSSLQHLNRIESLEFNTNSGLQHFALDEL